MKTITPFFRGLLFLKGFIGLNGAAHRGNFSIVYVLYPLAIGIICSKLRKPNLGMI
jgi:hypothetical protein